MVRLISCVFVGVHVEGVFVGVVFCFCFQVEFMHLGDVCGVLRPCWCVFCAILKHCMLEISVGGEHANFTGNNGALSSKIMRLLLHLRK